MAKNLVHGILIELSTGSETFAQTSDNAYIGIVGKGGGSEFPITWHEEGSFPKSSEVKYIFGSVYTGITGTAHPPDPDGWNDPRNRQIIIEDVDYVYLRKEGTRQLGYDNAWKVEKVKVVLYAPDITSPTPKRTFERGDPIWLANEYGLQVYLVETTD